MTFLSGKRVLLVEDEYFLADEIERALVEDGAIVVGPFPTRGEAELALQHGPIDIAVLNVRVRDGVTYPLAKLLRDKGVPFIFATGQEVHGEPAEWHDAPWINKPYSPDDVSRLITRLLA